MDIREILTKHEIQLILLNNIHQARKKNQQTIQLTGLYHNTFTGTKRVLSLSAAAVLVAILRHHIVM